MKKGQVNLIMALGMGLVVVWALGRIFLFTASVGTSTNIRQEIIQTMQKNEKNRKLVTQERQYALDRAILLTGIEGGMNDSECGFIKTKNKFSFLPTLNGRINYWRDNDKLCIPSEENLSKSVKEKLNTYLSNTIPVKLGVIGSISSNIELRLERHHDEYNGTLNLPMLETKYEVTLFCEEDLEFSKCPFPNRSVRFESGDETKEAGLQENVQLDNSTIKVSSIQDLEIGLIANKTNKLTNKKVWAKCVEIEGNDTTFFVNRSDGRYHYWIDKDEGCFETLGKNVEKISNGTKLRFGSPEVEYVVKSVYPLSVERGEGLVNKIFIESSSYKVLNLKRKMGGISYIHFVPKEMTFKVPEAKILERTNKLGGVNYKFIPSGGARLCTVGRGQAEKYSVRTCGSLLTEANRVGSLPLLYSYAKDYVNGTYGTYGSYQNFAIDQWLRDEIDGVNMKTLKVRTNGKILPKWGWKYNLINNLGLQNLKIEESELDENACERVSFNDGDISYSIEFCNRTNYGGDINPVLKDSLRENMKAFFKQTLISKLNSLTNVKWNIGIKDFHVSVKNTCEGQTVTTHYSRQNNYNSNEKFRAPSRVIGMPQQIRFGYKDDLTISPESSELICKINEYWGNKTGDPCFADTGKIGNCHLNEEMGINLKCTQFNYCCPQNYEIPLSSGDETHPCCQRLNDEDFPYNCNGDKKYTTLKYSCYDRNAVSRKNYTAGVPCEEGQIGKVKWIEEA